MGVISGVNPRYWTTLIQNNNDTVAYQFVMIDPKLIQQKLAALREDYRKSLPNILAEITALWSTLSEQWESSALNTIQRHAHSLAGSGATFGFSNISSVARELDTALKTIDVNDTAAHTAIYTTIFDKIKVLTQACNAAMSDDNNPSVSDALHRIPQADKTLSLDTVLLIHINTVTVLDTERLQRFRYQLISRTINSPESLPELMHVIQENRPANLIYDIDEFSSDNLKLIDEINQHLTDDIPKTFISRHGNIEQRLAAIRHGSDAFLAKPIEAGMLVEKLDSFGNQDLDPFCIMIIEDMPSIANTYAIYLEMAGMQTIVVTDPLQVCETLCEYRPDLILLDMYMPNCSGPELAMVIRQTDAMNSIPIVFLSMESDINQQLNAMRRGGDDFLTKPISPEHLVNAVKIRARRYRELRTYMFRDSLTGLLNHSKSVDQLKVEISRAERSQEPLAYVMLDIDHFKSINDNYGHAAGDQVLRALAHLLQRSIRNTDVVGRYGGEEFVLILYGATWEPAFDIMENLRKDFEKMKYSFNNHEVNATFSCGIAIYPEIKDIDTLQNEADKALYLAKNQGRNRTVLANPDIKFD